MTEKEGIEKTLDEYEKVASTLIPIRKKRLRDLNDSDEKVYQIKNTEKMKKYSRTTVEAYRQVNTVFIPSASF